MRILGSAWASWLFTFQVVSAGVLHLQIEHRDLKRTAGGTRTADTKATVPVKLVRRMNDPDDEWVSTSAWTPRPSPRKKPWTWLKKKIKSIARRSKRPHRFDGSALEGGQVRLRAGSDGHEQRQSKFGMPGSLRNIFAGRDKERMPRSGARHKPGQYPEMSVRDERQAAGSGSTVPKHQASQTSRPLPELAESVKLHRSFLKPSRRDSFEHRSNVGYSDDTARITGAPPTSPRRRLSTLSAGSIRPSTPVPLYLQNLGTEDANPVPLRLRSRHSGNHKDSSFAESSTSSIPEKDQPRSNSPPLDTREREERRGKLWSTGTNVLPGPPRALRPKTDERSDLLLPHPVQEYDHEHTESAQRQISHVSSSSTFAPYHEASFAHLYGGRGTLSSLNDLSLRPSPQTSMRQEKGLSTSAVTNQIVLNDIPGWSTADSHALDPFLHSKLSDSHSGLHPQFDGSESPVPQSGGDMKSFRFLPRQTGTILERPSGQQRA